MTVLQEIEVARENAKYSQWVDTPICPDDELVGILGKTLMDLARANPDNCTAMVTQALALFHMWEANRR